MGCGYSVRRLYHLKTIQSEISDLLLHLDTEHVSDYTLYGYIVHCLHDAQYIMTEDLIRIDHLMSICERYPHFGKMQIFEFL